RAAEQIPLPPRGIGITLTGDKCDQGDSSVFALIRGPICVYLRKPAAGPSLLLEAFYLQLQFCDFFLEFRDFALQARHTFIVDSATRDRRARFRRRSPILDIAQQVRIA